MSGRNLAALDLAQTWTAEQTFRENVAIGDASGSPGESRVSFRALSAFGYGVIDYQESTFNATRDPSLYVGLNQGADGNQVVAGQAAISMGFENHYNDGTADIKTEAYIQIVPTAGGVTRYRPLFVQHNQTSNYIATTLAGDQVDVAYSDNTTRIARFVRNALTIETSDPATDTFLVLAAATGRASKIQMGRNGVANVLELSMVSASQAAIIIKDQANTQQGVLRMYSSKASATAKCVAIGADDTSATLVVVEIGRAHV